MEKRPGSGKGATNPKIRQNSNNLQRKRVIFDTLFTNFYVHNCSAAADTYYLLE